MDKHLPGDNAQSSTVPGDDQIDQKSLAKLLAVAAAVLHKTTPSASSAGLSPEVLNVLTQLEPLLEKDPDAGNEALRLYMAKYHNVLKDVTLQQLYAAYKEKESEYCSDDRIDKVASTANNFCRRFGWECPEIDLLGGQRCDMLLKDVTEERIAAYAQELPGGWANAEISALRTLLAFGVKDYYLRKNPAEGIRRRLKRKERIEIAQNGITLDSLEEVQIALDIAAGFVGGELGKQGKPGGLVWMVVLRYYGNLRPEAELPNFDPAEIRGDSFRVFSTKTERMRGKDLAANAMIMLDYYWPEPRSMDTTGWRQLWELIKAAQNRYLRDAGKKVPVKRFNRPRHTGSAHSRFLKKRREQFLSEDDHNGRNFEEFYNGLSPRSEAAPFFRLHPHAMQLTKESEDRVRNYLLRHELIEIGDPLPQLPDVSEYVPKLVTRKLWTPTIPLEQLRDLIFAVGIRKAAKQLGTDESWLSSMCRALQVPVPPPGRSEARKHPELAEIPLPLTTLPDEEIEQLIKKKHGLVHAAKSLEMAERDLRAWCCVRGIKVPSSSELGYYYNKRERVPAHREEVSRLLKKDSLPAVAEHLGISCECLERFCNNHGITFYRSTPPPPPQKPGMLEQIRRELALNAQPPRNEEEAIAWVLSRGNGELKESELAAAVESAFGLRLEASTIGQIADQHPLRYEHRNGSVRLVGRYQCELDLTAVKVQLKNVIGTMPPVSLLEAIRRALELTFSGLTLEQLAELLPIFGIQLSSIELHKELKRLDRLNRIRFVNGRVTVSEVSFDFRRRLRDSEATPGLAQLRQKVKETYGGIVEQSLSNLEKLRLILHFAPDGLWQAEIAEVAAFAGIELRESAIECVPGHEGKGELRRNSGRVEMIVDRFALVQKSALADACWGAEQLDRMGLVLHLLCKFSGGLNMYELAWACSQGEQRVSMRSFARWLSNQQHPKVKIEDGRAYFVEQVAAEAA